MSQVLLSEEELNKAIEEITALPFLDRLDSESGCCIELSRRLKMLLHERKGIDTEQRVGDGHVSLLYRGQSEDDSVHIDSTYLQLFDGDGKSEMPRILVGTKSTIQELFQSAIDTGNLRLKRGIKSVEELIGSVYVNTYQHYN